MKDIDQTKTVDKGYEQRIKEAVRLYFGRKKGTQRPPVVKQAPAGTKRPANGFLF